MSTNGFNDWQQLPWSDGERQVAIKMQQDGHNYSQIAQALGHGRTNASVRGFFRRLGRQTGKKLAWPEDIKTSWVRQRASSKNVVHGPIAPPEAINSRDARFLEPRTLTMELLGDPTPSQSALGRFCD